MVPEALLYRSEQTDRHGYIGTEIATSPRLNDAVTGRRRADIPDIRVALPDLGASPSASEDVVGSLHQERNRYREP